MSRDRDREMKVKITLSKEDHTTEDQGKDRTRTEDPMMKTDDRVIVQEGQVDRGTLMMNDTVLTMIDHEL